VAIVTPNCQYPNQVADAIRTSRASLAESAGVRQLTPERPKVKARRSMLPPNLFDSWEQHSTRLESLARMSELTDELSRFQAESNATQAELDALPRQGEIEQEAALVLEGDADKIADLPRQSTLQARLRDQNHRIEVQQAAIELFQRTKLARANEAAAEEVIEKTLRPYDKGLKEWVTRSVEELGKALRASHELRDALRSTGIGFRNGLTDQVQFMSVERWEFLRTEWYAAMQRFLPQYEITKPEDE
jgi:hypothetical protein